VRVLKYNQKIRRNFMKSIKIALMLVFIILFSLSCAFLARSVTGNGNGGGGGGGGGPKGFTAEASPYGSVKLKWDAVEGAQISVIEHQLDGFDNFIPVMAFSAAQTSYEDFLAPKESKLTYRVQVFTDGKPGGYSTASVTTTSVLPNPLTVQATFAEDQVVTQSIGPEGGSMSLKDQKGVLYELKVPAGAVLAATDFTLTPVSDIQVWPLDGANLGSVRIGPEGLDLNAHLTLTITVPDGFPKDGTFPVGYGFDGNGNEFHIFPAGVTGAGISTQSVNKAGSQGVGTGSKLKIIEFAIEHWLTQWGVNINQLLVAQQLVDGDLPPLPAQIPPAAKAILKDIDALYIQREMNDLLAQINNAEADNKTDCASATLWYDNSRDLLEQASNTANIDNFQSTTTQELAGSLNDAITTVVTNGISECKASTPGKPLAGRSCLQRLVSKLQIDSNKTNGSFTVPRGDFNPSDLQDFQNTLNNSCSNPAYRLPAGVGGTPGGTFTPDPICDLNQPFIFTVAPMSADGELFDGTITFNPPGTVLEHFSYMGCTADATGTYTLQVSEDASQVTIDWSFPSITATCPDAGGLTVPVPPLTSSPAIVLTADPSASCPVK
jgi:hypothetical protein